MGIAPGGAIGGAIGDWGGGGGGGVGQREVDGGGGGIGDCDREGGGGVDGMFVLVLGQWSRLIIAITIRDHRNVCAFKVLQNRPE